jgi:toxin HigB-1
MIITNHGTLSSSYPFGVGKERGPARDHIAESAVTAHLRRGGWALGAHSSGVLSITLDVINATRYAGGIVIQSFGNADTARAWRREHVRRLGSDLQRIANRKLLILDAAETLNDLRVPPGNRLEQLRGDRAGQHSIRINDQWRICFTWTSTGPTNVEITDYH